MTRWSLRRRPGATRDAAPTDKPVAAASATLPDAGQPHPAPGQPQFVPGQPQFVPGQPHPAPGQLRPLPVRPHPLLLHEQPVPGAAITVTAGIAGATVPGWDALATPGEAGEAAVPAAGAWPDICDQFGLQLLVLAEQLRSSLDELEADEDDPERLQRLYHVDHAVTRMRRVCRDLRTLAGRSEEELAGFTSSLLDIVRMAASAIERYTQVALGRITDLAVLGYAADDVGALLAALLDNATRYSPGAVTVSAHLLEDGAVMFRIEDTGIGMGADQVTVLNALFAGPVPGVDDRTGRHTGFPVVHRIARKHSIGVRLVSRPLPGRGTIAMVTLPPHLLCEVPPADGANHWLSPAASAPAEPPAPLRPSVVPDLSRRERPGPAGPPRRSGVSELPVPAGQPEQPEQPDQPGTAAAAEHGRPLRPGELPRRERASLRGAAPRSGTAARSPQQQAAARRAFAEDLSAFSVPGPGSAGNAAGTALDGTQIEEGARK